jgi:hypothetical protein
MRSVASRQVFDLDLVDQEASFAMGALLCTDESSLQVRLPRSTIHAYCSIETFSSEEVVAVSAVDSDSADS